MTARRFIKWWLAGLLGLLALTSLINAVVDPYEMYGWVSVGGFNDRKTQAIDYSRLIKPYLIERSNPTTLLIGSSRVEVGFNPEDPAWPAAMQPVFNLAIVASGPPEQYRILQHALVTARPKYVILGVSFADAHVPPTHRLAPAVPTADQQEHSDFDARLSVTVDGKPNPRQAAVRVKDLAATLLSLDALGDSILTVLNQRTPNRSLLTSQGFNTAAGFRNLVASDGAYGLFIDKDRIKVDEIIPWVMEPRLQTDEVRQAIALALHRGAEVIVVIAPVQADEMEIYRQAGALQRYDAWRRQITDIVAAGALSGKASLWDFSAISSYTTEPLPPPGDKKTQSRWFWESNHFKSSLGSLVIARMVGDPSVDFGTLITPETLAGVQAAQHELLRQYEKTHPGDVKRVADLYAAQLQQACRASPEFCQNQRPTINNEASHSMAVEQEQQHETP